MKFRLAKNLLPVILICSVLCGGALAGEPVKYIDAFWDGGKVVTEEKEVTDYKTAGSGTWTDGWYVAKSSVTVTTRITVSGTVNLILCDGVKLSALNGIEVDDPNTLNIYAQRGGTGTLYADSPHNNRYYGHAAIGGNQYQPCGNVTINGGIVTAVPSIENPATGIGGGKDGGGGNITINGGTVTATGGNYYSGYWSSNEGGAGIGGGHNGSCGSVTINGGTVTATASDSGGAAIGGGKNGNGGTVTINGGTVKVIGGGAFGSTPDGIGIGPGDYGNGGSVTITGGTVISGYTGSAIKAKTVTIDGGNIDVKSYNSAIDGDVVKINGGTVTLIGDDAGIRVKDGGTVEITGGTVNASGNKSYKGSGIDGEYAAVRITGGTVNANGGYEGAGIRSKHQFETCGAVTISGGTVNATGGNGGAGIGSGKNESCGAVKITGGTVNATGGYEGAGIGGGSHGTGGNVEITGGNVTATGGNGGATLGIGAGLDNDDNGTLTLGLYVQLFGGTTPNPTSIIEQSNGDYARYRYMTAEKITPPEISGNFANGVVKAEYTSEITISGDTAPYTWTKTEGTIPNGLALTSSDLKAVLSGTPTKAGTFKFTLKVTDKNNISVTKSFTVKITQTKISGTFTPEGAVKKSYSVSIKASSGTAPYTWTRTKGTLPAGLKLTYSGANAKLAGTPTKAGTYTFTLKVTDKNKSAVTKSFTVKITQPEISGSFANGVIKKAYSGNIKVSGGTAPYSWSKTSGTLPTGLKLTYSNTKVTLSGTPTKAGTYTFTLKAMDKNKAAATKSFTVKVTQPVISGTLANGVIKKAYSGSVTVNGGTSAYTWSKTSGTLPTGLKLTYSGAKATLSGTPTKAGTYTFTLKATDKNKAAATKSFTVKITQPVFSGTFTANGAVKKSYSSSVTVSGGTSAYTWTKSSGTLPTGLKLTYSGTKVTLSGTPTKAGTYKFTLKVTDKNKATATKTFTVSIITSKPEIPYDFIYGTVKVSYKDYVMAENGTEPYTWTKTSGTIPTGLKLTYSGGAAFLSGTPTKAGTFKFTLKVTDKNKAAVSKTFTVKIAAAKSSNDTKSDNESSPEPETKTEQKQDTKSSPEDKSTLPEKQLQLPANGENVVTLSADLKVVSDDIIESYDGRDSDLVKVHADKPLRFTVSNWGAEISSAVVYVDDKALNGITVSDEGLFILPAEIVSGDFKVGVKAHSEAGELESSELYIIAE